jgi:hypothetical protein
MSLVALKTDINSQRNDEGHTDKCEQNYGMIAQFNVHLQSTEEVTNVWQKRQN